MTVMTFGELLRRTRKRYRLTQTDLANAVGIATSYVSRIERGQRKPTRETVLAIAEALGADLEQTNNFLFCAGYAPVVEVMPTVRPYMVAGTREHAHGPSTRTTPLLLADWQEVPDHQRTANRMAEVVTGILEDDQLSPEHRRAMLLVFDALPTWLEDIKNIVIRSSAPGLEVQRAGAAPGVPSIAKSQASDKEGTGGAVVPPGRASNPTGRNFNRDGTTTRRLAGQGASSHFPRSNLVAYQNQIDDLRNSIWNALGEQGLNFSDLDNS